MKSTFGLNDQRTLALIARIADLSAEDVDKVTNAWKLAGMQHRAKAWAWLVCTCTEQERYWLLATASLARREAISAARRLHRTDWAFWAAASDAAAAVAASAPCCYYHTLTAPLAEAVPSLTPCPDRTRGGMADEPPVRTILGKGA